MQATSAHHSRRAAYLLMAVLVVVWGAHWPVAKVGLQTMPPFTYAVLRVTSAVLVFAVLLGLRGRLRRPPREDIPIVLSVGLGQIAGTIGLMNLGLLFVPAGRSAILGYTMPLWVALIQLIALRVRLSRGEAVGLLLGMTGVLLLILPGAADWRASGVAVGSALLLLMAFIAAAVLIHVRHHRWRSTPLDLQIWQLLVGLPPLIVLALAFEHGESVNWDLTTILVLLYSGPLATAFAFWASQSIARAIGPMATTIGYLAVPLVGLAASAVMLGERITALDVVALLVTAAGIAAVSFLPSRSSAPGVAIPAGVDSVPTG